ncbi:hypothetical protein [Lacticaseibacillus jixiensis]|uniref:hypothetical protein n=1 Tax=Lacticaseibacillus TaxID=2759736 RepID=UPI0036F329BD
MYTEQTKMGELLKLPAVIAYLKTAAPEYLDAAQAAYIQEISLGAIASHVDDAQRQVLQTVLDRANGTAS